MKIFNILLLLLVFGCKNSNNDSVYEYEKQESNEYQYGYLNGTYCAEVEYYYSETGTQSTYTLEVEIENNLLTVIHWPNGGWLDSSHFSPPEISDGEANFTSDTNVDYTIRIIGEEGDCITDSYVKDEDDILREKEDNEAEENYRIQHEYEFLEAKDAQVSEAEAVEASEEIGYE